MLVLTKALPRKDTNEEGKPIRGHVGFFRRTPSGRLVYVVPRAKLTQAEEEDDDKAKKKKKKKPASTEVEEDEKNVLFLPVKSLSFSLGAKQRHLFPEADDDQYVLLSTLYEIIKRPPTGDSALSSLDQAWSDVTLGLDHPEDHSLDAYLSKLLQAGLVDPVDSVQGAKDASVQTYMAWLKRAAGAYTPTDAEANIASAILEAAHNRDTVELSFVDYAMMIAQHGGVTPKDAVQAMAEHAGVSSEKFGIRLTSEGSPWPDRFGSTKMPVTDLLGVGWPLKSSEGNVLNDAVQTALVKEWTNRVQRIARSFLSGVIKRDNVSEEGEGVTKAEFLDTYVRELTPDLLNLVLDLAQEGCVEGDLDSFRKKASYVLERRVVDLYMHVQGAATAESKAKYAVKHAVQEMEILEKTLAARLKTLTQERKEILAEQAGENVPRSRMQELTDRLRIVNTDQITAQKDLDDVRIRLSGFSLESAYNELLDANAGSMHQSSLDADEVMELRELEGKIAPLFYTTSDSVTERIRHLRKQRESLLRDALASEDEDEQRELREEAASADSALKSLVRSYGLHAEYTGDTEADLAGVTSFSFNHDHYLDTLRSRIETLEKHKSASNWGAAELASLRSTLATEEGRFSELERMLVLDMTQATASHGDPEGRKYATRSFDEVERIWAARGVWDLVPDAKAKGLLPSTAKLEQESAVESGARAKFVKRVWLKALYRVRGNAFLRDQAYDPELQDFKRALLTRQLNAAKADVDALKSAIRQGSAKATDVDALAVAQSDARSLERAVSREAFKKDNGGTLAQVEDAIGKIEMDSQAFSRALSDGFIEGVKRKVAYATGKPVDAAEGAGVVEQARSALLALRASQASMDDNQIEDALEAIDSYHTLFHRVHKIKSNIRPFPYEQSKDVQRWLELKARGKRHAITVIDADGNEREVHTTHGTLEATARALGVHGATAYTLHPTLLTPQFSQEPYNVPHVSRLSPAFHRLRSPEERKAFVEANFPAFQDAVMRDEDTDTFDAMLNTSTIPFFEYTSILKKTFAVALRQHGKLAPDDVYDVAAEHLQTYRDNKTIAANVKKKGSGYSKEDADYVESMTANKNEARKAATTLTRQLLARLAHYGILQAPNVQEAVIRARTPDPDTFKQYGFDSLQAVRDAYSDSKKGLDRHDKEIRDLEDAIEIANDNNEDASAPKAKLRAAVKAKAKAARRRDALANLLARTDVDFDEIPASFPSHLRPDYMPKPPPSLYAPLPKARTDAPTYRQRVRATGVSVSKHEKALREAGHAAVKSAFAEAVRALAEGRFHEIAFLPAKDGTHTLHPEARDFFTGNAEVTSALRVYEGTDAAHRDANTASGDVTPDVLAYIENETAAYAGFQEASAFLARIPNDAPQKTLNKEKLRLANKAKSTTADDTEKKQAVYQQRALAFLAGVQGKAFGKSQTYTLTTSSVTGEVHAPMYTIELA